MVNEELVGGLKSGIERGESLQKVMISFFNAGYTKEEIEEAARALSSSPSPEQPQAAQPAAAIKAPKVHSPLLKLPSSNTQKASGYGQKDSKNKILIIIMIALALVFVGVLVLFLTSK